jgi:outer membrane autotransporter protein
VDPGSEVYAGQRPSLSVAGATDSESAGYQLAHVDRSSGAVLGVSVTDRVLNVDASALPDDYSVGTKGILNVFGGASVLSINVMFGQVRIESSNVLDGITLSSGQASIRDSQVHNNAGTGIIASDRTDGVYYHGGSKADIVRTSVSGAGIGILVGPSSTVSVQASDVTAAANWQWAGEGIRVSSGTLAVGGGSAVKGAENGLKIIDMHMAQSEGDNKIVVDNSSVEGGTGAAVLVQTNRHLTELFIQNGSTLQAGNNTLLDVRGSGLTHFNVDSSTLTGNLVADHTSTLNVKLQNRAQLTGNIVNSETLAINSGASWTMVDDGQVKSLTMEGGRVDLGQGAFKTLTLNELSGSGIFDMRINLDNHEGDLLKVAGLAQGSHSLRVRNTGIEAVKPDTQPLLLVDTDGGDAQFSLVGNRADLGVYSYELEQQGDDWFIVGSGKVISPSTESVLALFNAAPNIWNSELSTLRGRMNEIRGREQGGGWMRAYGSRFNASTGDGVDYRNNQSGLSLGADGVLPVSLGELSLGLMAGYSKNDLAVGKGTSGKVGSFYVGGYGTWTLDEGYYVDAVLKLNRFRNESTVAMSDGTKSQGDYQSTGLGGSLEFGRHINFADGYFIEPFAQVSSVWVQGDSYALDNGMRASNDRTTSVLGKIGATAGRSVVLQDGGTLRPYLRMAAVQEFSRKNEVEVNDTRFDNQLSGSRAELGAGVSVSLTERLQVQADFEYMKGKNVEQPWGANVGLKLAF